MSEVTNVHVAAKPTLGTPAGTASSQGPVTKGQQVSALLSGNKLPPGEAKGVGNTVGNAAQFGKNVEEAMASVSDFVQSVQRNLQFSVDETLNRTVIKVVDSHSGEVIRQIPEEVFLELARKLRDDGEFQLVSALG